MTKFAEILSQARQCLEGGDQGRAEKLCRQLLRMQPANPDGQFLLGLVYQRSRRLDEALRCFQKVQRVRPGSAEVYYAQGGVYQEQGNLEAAAAAFREALRLRPDLVAAQSCLGLVLLAQGKADEAEACCRLVLRACPQVPEAHAHLAGALQAQGKLDDAVAAYHEALRLNPDFAAARNNLGNLFLSQGRKREAADCFVDVLRVQPGFVEAHYNLGTVCQELGQLTQAAACYEQAIRMQPAFAPAHNALGMVYILQDQRQKAAECFHQALRLQPGQPLAYANLGTFLLEEGRREEAAGQFQEALRHDPSCVQALAAVAHFGLFPLSDAELARIHALLANPGLSPSQASQLHFGLGNMLDRAGAWNEAFAHVAKGNAQRRELMRASGTAFDAGEHRTRMDRTIATCDPAFFQRARSFGRDTERPVFIVGMPRSGTSLVEQILGSHPQVFGAGELWNIYQLAHNMPSRQGSGTDYPTCLALSDAPLAGVLADAYLQELERRNSAARRVTDKMPSNFEHLGLIAALFPRARVIHCLRDPLDVGLSCFFQDFQEVNFSCDLEDIAEYYRQYVRLMAHWRAVLPLSMLEVQYEEMVNDPETFSRRLIAFCGLEWDDRCLRHDRAHRAVRTSSLVQVRQPVYKSAVGRWRNYAEQLQPLQERLAQPADDAAPGLARAHARLGDVLVQHGRTQEAAGHYREALGHDPECIPALAAVCWHGLYPLTDPQLGRIDALLSEPRLGPADAARLHFGRAHVHDRAGEYDQSFAHFSLANTLRRRLLREAGKAFDPTYFQAWVDQAMATCNADYFRQVQGWGREAEVPVFIVGMPRSGTSLVEQILASHPQVGGAGELLEIGRLMSGLMEALPAGEHYPRRERLDRATCAALADHYLQILQGGRAGALRVTDKTPNNFQFLGLIAALLPRARVIHCTRDAADVCFSCFTQDFTEWTLNLEELAVYYRAYERLMAHWRSVLPLPLLEVAYEDLVNDPEAVSRRLVAFCGLEWDNRCLAYHQSQREVRTASVLQVRLPVYKSSLGRWRQYAAHLRPLLDGLEGGGETTSGRPDVAQLLVQARQCCQGGDLLLAATLCRQILRAQPEHAEAWFLLGGVMRQQGQLSEAATCYQRAIDLQPGAAPAYHALAMVYLQDDQRGPALHCFQQLLRLEPANSVAHANLASFLLEEGRREEAATHLQEALRRDPHCVPALTTGASLGLYPLTETERERMHALLTDPRLSTDQVARLHFALGNVYDRAGNYDQAFSHFRQANALRLHLFRTTGKALDLEQHHRWVDRMIATCGRCYFERVHELGRDTERPVFIVGMPRSGTSLVEQILATHPDVFGAGELPHLQALAARAGEYPECLGRMDQATAGALADQYLQQLGRRAGAAVRVTDKMPTNFEHLGLIAALFPRARIIHCVRDPRDVCLSCYFQDFRNMNFAWDLRDLGQYYREYERLMAHWRSVAPLSLLEVRYENLVENLEAVSRQLVAFCGLAWDERCLEYHRNRRTVRTVSLLQVRQPVYQHAVGRWRHYQTYLQPLLDALE